MVTAADLRGLLGLPATRDPAPPPSDVVSTSPVPGGTRYELRIGGIPATFLTPGETGRAVLYCHAHGGAYDLGRRELTEGAPWLSGPWAADLLATGASVLCLDMPGFGDRQAMGRESALAKAALWQGRPLFGQMLADLERGLDWLGARGVRDIVAMGTSMGAAHAFWLAALDPRVSAVVQLCMLADAGPMIADGAHDGHGFYLTVPGLLARAEIGDVAGLVAPRPQFVGHGEADHLTPTAARTEALARVRRAYAGAPGALITYLEPGGGHAETPEMRRAVLRFLSDRPHT